MPGGAQGFDSLIRDLKGETMDISKKADEIVDQAIGYGFAGTRAQILNLVADVVAEERQKLETSQADVRNLRRLMGHWSTVDLALKWQEQVLSELEATKLQNDLMRRTLDNIARNAKSDFVAHGAFGVSAIAMVAAKCLKDIEEGLERRSDAKPVAHVLAPEERCNSTYGAYQCSREKDHCGCHIWYPNPERIEWDSDDESPKSLKRVSEPGKCPECGEA